MNTGESIPALILPGWQGKIEDATFEFKCFLRENRHFRRMVKLIYSTLLGVNNNI